MTKLVNPIPDDVTLEGRARVEIALRSPRGLGCDCEGARLVKRQVGSAWVVTIQCRNCGRQVGSGPIKRSNFPSWEDFRVWDDDLPINWSGEFHRASRAALDERASVVNAAIAKDRAEFSQKYNEWLRSSPEWHALRARVLKRAGFICEACLAERATVAHHLTYKLGRLPPAWELRAVCDRCHDRFHADKLGATDEWCR